MLFKLFDEGDPVIPASTEVVPDKGKKESKDQKPESPKDKPEIKPEDKPKDDGKDYKALHEASEAKLKEFESGVTPKLMKLAELEKVEEARKPKEDDDLARIDKRIADTKQNIALYKADRLDTMTLENDVDSLEFRRKRIIEDKHAQAVSKHWDDFESEHSEFTDIAGLTKIIKNGARKGEVIGLETAYSIWEKDQAIAKANDSAAIDKENRGLGSKATGQDGKPIPEDKGSEGFRKADVDFYTDQLGSKDKALKMLKSFKK